MNIQNTETSFKRIIITGEIYVSGSRLYYKASNRLHLYIYLYDS